MLAAPTTTAKKDTKIQGTKEVTTCPSTPCAIFYSDIFGIIEVRCLSSIHNNNNSVIGKNLEVTSLQQQEQTNLLTSIPSKVNKPD